MSDKLNCNFDGIVDGMTMLKNVPTALRNIGPQIWNMIPSDIKELNTLAKFKNVLAACAEHILLVQVSSKYGICNYVFIGLKGFFASLMVNMVIVALKLIVYKCGYFLF